MSSSYLTIWPVPCAFLVGLALLAGYRHYRLVLARRHLELRPNCLLTRFPLVFVTGPRSIFYFSDYWNFIPTFLREHGFEVQVWRLPWRNPEARLCSMKARAAALQRPVHLIFDSSVSPEVRTVLAQIKNLRSATVTELSSREQELAFHSELFDPKEQTAAVFKVRMSHSTTIADRSSLAPKLAPPLFRPQKIFASLQSAALWAHARVVSHRPVPTEIGLDSLLKPSASEWQFLDFAISLAEADMECSH